MCAKLFGPVGTHGHAHLPSIRLGFPSYNIFDKICHWIADMTFFYNSA
jgi:hypothetical protein